MPDDNNDENLDSNNEEENKGLEQSEDETNEDFIERLKENNKQLYERTKKAESKNKEKKDEKKTEKKDVKKEGKDIVSQDDKSYFYAKGGTRTELGFLRKAMKAEECDFDTAWKSDLFKAMKAENDKKIKSKGSKLPPSGPNSTPNEDRPLPANAKEKRFSEYMQNKAKSNRKVFSGFAKTKKKVNKNNN